MTKLCGAIGTGKHGERYQPLGIQLQRSDWQEYCRDSVYLLAAGYVDLIVSSVAGVLTARLSETDAAANQIVARVQSYPLIFTGALSTVAITLGSRYLGERQQSRFLQLGIALLSWGCVLALGCGLGLFVFAHTVFGFFTNDPAKLAALEPASKVLPLCIGAQLVNAVTGGLVLAACKEWVWLPATSALSLAVVYAPAVAWVTHTGRTSVASLLAINAGFVVLQALCKLLVLCIVMPRKLRRDLVAKSDLALGPGRLSLFDSLFESTPSTASITEVDRDFRPTFSASSSDISVVASRDSHIGGAE